MSQETRAGFVGIIGAPNAGKSTFLNTVVGSKVSIVTHKAQTTRCRVHGIIMRDAAQIVFIDTPGVFEKTRHRLDKAMVAAAWQGARDADVLILLLDAARKNLIAETKPILAGLQKMNQPVLVVFNKIDLVKKEELLALIAEIKTLGDFVDVFLVSALKDEGLDVLLDRVVDLLPAGPWLYPEDQISDMPLRLLAAEITREQIFLRLHDELPYAISVQTESWEEKADGSVAIGQVIYVQRQSQKGIVLGKKGQQIKTIGMAARQEIEKIIEGPAHLKLFVKHQEKWIDDREHYQGWGLDFDA